MNDISLSDNAEAVKQHTTDLNEDTADVPVLPESQRLDSAGLRNALAQFTGTEQWYRHGLNKNLLYTDGVQFFAEHGGCYGAYWFLDKVAFEFWPLQKEVPFLSIFMVVSNDSTATLHATNGNERVLKTNRIEYTDMQPGEWRFYLIDNILLLASEY